MKKYLIAAPFLGAAYFLSFFRHEYASRVAHIICNRRITGKFTKILTDKGWQCVQNGQVVETVNFTPSTIPTPIELTIALFSIIIIGLFVKKAKEHDVKMWYNERSYTC